MAYYLTTRLTSWNSINFRIVPTILLRDYTNELSSKNSTGPLQVLKQKIDNGEMVQDEYQMKVVESLQKVYDELNGYEPEQPGFFNKWLGKNRKKKKPPKGLYLYGAVGGGKTMLMDLFYNCSQVIRKFYIKMNFMKAYYSFVIIDYN